MIIVDSSVVVNALTDDDHLAKRARVELARDAHWVAPEHVVVEVFSAIRGLLLGRDIPEERAWNATGDLNRLRIDLLDTAQLLSRMWRLKDNISAYDSAYVAAAQVFECPMVTADARLARAARIHCEVRLAV